MREGLASALHVTRYDAQQDIAAYSFAQRKTPLDHSLNGVNWLSGAALDAQTPQTARNVAPKLYVDKLLSFLFSSHLSIALSASHRFWLTVDSARRISSATL